MLADTPELRAFLHEVAGLPVPTVEELEQMEEEEDAAAEKMRQQIAGQTNQEDDEDEEEQPQGRQFTEPFSTDLIERAKKAWEDLAPDRWRGALDADIRETA
jgi:hypothetical protein